MLTQPVVTVTLPATSALKPIRDPFAEKAWKRQGLDTVGPDL